ncbi:hypothetical protein Sjap_004163 [Stephania japonica]|uniref:Uncharacterized protein n=1 Tax=Stephania japonica TaxID=461633 RepID=A0AAP0K2T7_9MAGN
MFSYNWPAIVIRFIIGTTCLSSTHASAIVQFHPHFYMLMYGSTLVVGLIFSLGFIF